MRLFALLPPLFGAFAFGTFALGAGLDDSHGNINPQDNDTAMPQPKPGQSVADFIDMYFPDDDADEGQGEETQPDLTKRNYTNSKGVMISQWTNDTGGVEEDYEIDVDFSSCTSSLTFSTQVGIFTNSRGVSINGRSRSLHC